MHNKNLLRPIEDRILAEQLRVLPQNLMRGVEDNTND